MKPRSLLCCLIVGKIKMELSSQISDISGDLIPQQLFGIQEGSSAFFFALSLVICCPCWQELPLCCLYLAKSTRTGPRNQKLLKCRGEKRGMNAETHRGIRAECFQGEPLPNPCSSSSVTSAPHFAFSPLLPPPSSTKVEKESGVWEWITFSTLLSMSLFSLWKLSKESYICNRKPNKVGLFSAQRKGIKREIFCTSENRAICWLLATRIKKANGYHELLQPPQHLLLKEATLLCWAVFLRLITFC